MGSRPDGWVGQRSWSGLFLLYILVYDHTPAHRWRWPMRTASMKISRRAAGYSCPKISLPCLCMSQNVGCGLLDAACLKNKLCGRCFAWGTPEARTKSRTLQARAEWKARLHLPDRSIYP
ncbi:hypothetical protein B0I37DRAFT_106422 [Chaetomium sp. MPI-CAGE-AT-0009]|nr:hypothetical protein B0I37DRAFT_106422 [Chaetomium sp. MPI-CAGE-AT-0009]